MTTERPMFPPRAESVHASPHQPAMGQPASETLAGDSAKPAGDLSRRLLLVGLAAVGIPTSARLAAAERDPIYDAIEAHRQAWANYVRMVGVHSDLEEELPSKRRQSRVDAWGEEIAEGDDPRWIWSEREVSRLSRLGDQAAIDLINVQPTTIAGVLALLAYVIAVDEAEPQAWPEDLIDDDKEDDKKRWHDRSHDWSHFLHRNLAESLNAIVQRGQS